MRFCVSGSYIYVPDEINKIVAAERRLNVYIPTKRSKGTQSNTETDKYGQKQSTSISFS